MTYTIKNYYKDLEEFLAKPNNYKHEHEGEGWVYMVSIIKAENLPENNKAEFVTWLYLMVMVDIVVFSYHNDSYLACKNELKTPKFEHGPTNTFMGPEVMISRFRKNIPGPDLKESFLNIVPEFKTLLKICLSKTNISFDELEHNIFFDKDLRKGLFAQILRIAWGLDLETKRLLNKKIR